MAADLHGLDPVLEAAVMAALADTAGAVSVVAIESPTGTALHTLDQDAWSSMIASLRSAYFSIQAAAARMVDAGTGGVILILAPVHALRTSAGCGLAAVAGSFMQTVAQVAAVELGDHGIRVNVLAVGPRHGSVAERTTAAVPLGRLTEPEDIARACRALAGEDSAYITGAIIPVDGGYQVTKAGGGSPFTD